MRPGVALLRASGGAAAPSTWNGTVAALPNLWGWWKLDETAGAAVTATDSSGNGRHGSYTAAGTQAAGLFSGSSQCQATLGNRIDVPDWTVPSTPSFTVGAMIKTTHNSAVEQQIFSGDGSGARVFQFNKNTSTHAIQAVFINPDVVGLTGATAINDGNPHLVIFTYDESLAAAAGRMKLYLDGTLDAQSSTSVSLTSSVTANLGIGARNGGLSTGLWAGSLDEAFFCDGAISSTDVAALWAARNL